MAKKRRAYEPGHSPKILVIIDDTPECELAIQFAISKAKRYGVGISLLCVIPPQEGQAWLGVGNIMQAEAEEIANSKLNNTAILIERTTGISPSKTILNGEPIQKIQEFIENDEDVSNLILAAGMGDDGPGPLVSFIASGKATNFPVPVTIIPTGLTDEEMDAIA